MPVPALKIVETSLPVAPGAPFAHPQRAPLLGQILQRISHLNDQDLNRALALQRHEDVQLGHILVAHGMVSERNLLTALSEQFQAPIADLDTHRPKADLLTGLSPETCLKHGFLPWFLERDKLVVACANPSQFDQICQLLRAEHQGQIELAIASAPSIQRHIAQIWSSDLSAKADSKCPPRYSCRTWARPLGRPIILAVLASLMLVGYLLPVPSMWLLFCWVMLNLLAMTTLRLTALGQQMQVWLAAFRNGTPKPSKIASISKLPKVSVLVPLYKEAEILPKLIARLARTDYPKELLEICLVLEEGDEKTHQAVRMTQLPPWMRAIEVPKSRLKTKPRAMNFALDFCRGDIIGIYDAEDAPESDQILRIVRHFHSTGPEVACIQSYLDYYNPKQNWLARCFTIEYAIWFRLVLQGVERMRLPVPLGGTSVFFRREALEKLGAWDAHNVTEDADLGMRLARFGYRCAFEPTTTHEEANCHTFPWIKQRSRWLKGYAMTWITHMRSPRALYRELGPKGFLTFNVLLLGTISSFLLAPAIWSFWLIAFGFTPAFASLLPDMAWQVLGATFVGSEIVLGVLGIVATSGKGHRFLIPWVPTMVAYWPLGTIAAYKALYELLFAPFYWDKTHHGISETET